MLAGVVTAISLSRAAMRNIRQNLFFALAYNTIGIPIAAGVLYPLLGLRLSPMIAAAAMALSSLSVVGNANRLRRYHPTALPDNGINVGRIAVEPHVDTPTTADQGRLGRRRDADTAVAATTMADTTRRATASRHNTRSLR